MRTLADYIDPVTQSSSRFSSALFALSSIPVLTQQTYNMGEIKFSL